MYAMCASTACREQALPTPSKDLAHDGEEARRSAHSHAGNCHRALGINLRRSRSCQRSMAAPLSRAMRSSSTAVMPSARSSD